MIEVHHILERLFGASPECLPLPELRPPGSLNCPVRLSMSTANVRRSCLPVGPPIGRGARDIRNTNDLMRRFVAFGALHLGPCIKVDTAHAPELAVVLNKIDKAFTALSREE